MIRMVLGLFIFAFFLCLWLVLPPDTLESDRTIDNMSGSGAEVTRATPLAGGPQEQVAGLPADQAGRIMASVEGTQPPTAIRTDDRELDVTATAVLRALGMAVNGPDPTEDALYDLTIGVLGDLMAVTGKTTVTQDTAASLELLVVQALQEGQSDSYIDLLLNEAALRGEIAVPRILVTANGRVDTHVLLASIVDEARIASGGAANPVPQEVSGDGIEVRVVQRAGDTGQYRFYTVNPGDSLGAIAARFYGSASRYMTIFEANRILLSSPDLLRVGQRLVIPEF
jgi:nucleoid-associated protein YgaU